MGSSFTIVHTKEMKNNAETSRFCKNVIQTRVFELKIGSYSIRYRLF